jgi:hypothetical protein
VSVIGDQPSRSLGGGGTAIFDPKQLSRALNAPSGPHGGDLPLGSRPAYSLPTSGSAFIGFVPACWQVAADHNNPSAAGCALAACPSTWRVRGMLKRTSDWLSKVGAWVTQPAQKWGLLSGLRRGRRQDGTEKCASAERSSWRTEYFKLVFGSSGLASHDRSRLAAPGRGRAQEARPEKAHDRR